MSETSWKSETVPLSHPITVGEKAIASVTIREPDVEALEQIDELGLKEGADIRVKQMRTILAAMSDLDRETVGKLHRDDFAKMAETIHPLLFGGAEGDDSSKNS